VRLEREVNSCQRHWDLLREAVRARGLSALVSEGGEEAARKMERQLAGEHTVDSYDPLLAAYWAIANNGMAFIAEVGGNPLLLLSAWPEEGSPERPPFERCTICYLNWMMDEHDRQCTEPDCQKPRGEAAHYDWMIERAADDQVEHWRSMQP
jgi:hypothetical protein